MTYVPIGIRNSTFEGFWLDSFFNFTSLNPYITKFIFYSLNLLIIDKKIIKNYILNSNFLHCCIIFNFHKNNHINIFLKKIYFFYTLLKVRKYRNDSEICIIDLKIEILMILNFLKF